MGVPCDGTAPRAVKRLRGTAPRAVEEVRARTHPRPPPLTLSRVPHSYKLFLDELTPERHFTQQGATLEQYTGLRTFVREQLATAGISTAVASGAGASGTAAAAEEGEEEREEVEKRRASAIDETARRCLAFTAKHRITPHFTEAQQLLAVFSDLQESDLFLMQNAQKLEDESEAVLQSIAAFETRSLDTTCTTESDIASLAASIEAAQRRLRLARNGSPVNGKSGTSGKPKDEMLHALHGHVKHTYAGCGLSASGATTTTVAMLKELEADFEKLNAQVLDMAESGGRGASSERCAHLLPRSRCTAAPLRARHRRLASAPHLTPPSPSSSISLPSPPIQTTSRTRRKWWGRRHARCSASLASQKRRQSTRRG